MHLTLRCILLSFLTALGQSLPVCLPPEIIQQTVVLLHIEDDNTICNFRLHASTNVFAYQLSVALCVETRHNYLALPIERNIQPPSMEP